VQLLAAAVPTWGVASAGSDMADGTPTATGQAVGHCEIPRLDRVARSEVRTRPLTLCGAGRLPPMAVCGLVPVLSEHWRGGGGDKKYCGAKHFYFSHLSFSGLDHTLSGVGKSDSISDVGSKTR
jgi:hypothetical protein